MSATVAARTLLRVSGTVQGVGFRPFVYRLAGELALGGFVRNDDAGVTVEVEGDPDAVAEFVRRLRSEAPPLARIEAVTVADLPACGERAFVIAGSVRAQAPQAQVSPDTATCPDCLAELFDPANRRHRYPFINCTNCGPRFTIVRGVPYDRALTTMAGFRMCPECRAEYEDPGDRRFHAEPNACPACGPQLSLLDADGVPLSVRERALAQAVDALRDGAIVAVKGLGGFHLACLAGDSRAVAALRARKHREHKPFALMVRDVAAARRLVSLTASDEMLLSGRERPIVLARARPGAPVAPAVAPGLRLLGVMLPYSPLHHLLMHDLGEPLVMTSGNLSEEPIAFEDGDAL
ncbi:MAG TPA: Sua5/YciO/YrdC/YwlC family protein, partial [Solirubrobacteraceae bacterium]|nr:Sua5/YciO/YrdC/YwlC family protein [Solirubrobacteraceae bacterium]